MKPQKKYKETWNDELVIAKFMDKPQQQKKENWDWRDNEEAVTVITDIPIIIFIIWSLFF